MGLNPGVSLIPRLPLIDHVCSLCFRDALAREAGALLPWMPGQDNYLFFVQNLGNLSSISLTGQVVSWVPSSN